MEYKKCRQSANRVISSAKEKKQKDCASDLNDPVCQNEIFRMAKQMVKERFEVEQASLNLSAIAELLVILDYCTVFATLYV